MRNNIRNWCAYAANNRIWHKTKVWSKLSKSEKDEILIELKETGADLNNNLWYLMYWRDLRWKS